MNFWWKDPRSEKGSCLETQWQKPIQNFMWCLLKQPLGCKSWYHLREKEYKSSGGDYLQIGH